MAQPAFYYQSRVDPTRFVQQEAAQPWRQQGGTQSVRRPIVGSVATNPATFVVGAAPPDLSWMQTEAVQGLRSRVPLADSATPETFLRPPVDLSWAQDQAVSITLRARLLSQRAEVLVSPPAVVTLSWLPTLALPPRVRPVQPGLLGTAAWFLAPPVAPDLSWLKTQGLSVARLRSARSAWHNATTFVAPPQIVVTGPRIIRLPAARQRAGLTEIRG